LKKRSNWDPNKFSRILKAQILRRYILSKIHPCRWIFRSKERSISRTPEDVNELAECLNCFRTLIQGMCPLCDLFISKQIEESIDLEKLTDFIINEISGDTSCKIKVADYVFNLEEDY